MMDDGSVGIWIIWNKPKPISYDGSVKINRNPDWSCIPDHPYKILITGV